MIRTVFLAGALLCALATPTLACDAMRPCYGNGRLLYGPQAVHQVRRADHQVRRSERQVSPRTLPPGLSRVMAEGAGRVARPRAWCGWWLGRHLGMLNRKLWLAANWAHVGRPAHGPAVGTIVVWRHHVGIITARADRGWVVKSGNDGHAVRERPRSVAGAIAFRWPA